MRLKYNRLGWFRLEEWRTGSIDFRTGVHIPYIRDGIAWPEFCQLRIGPYETAREAMNG